MYVRLPALPPEAVAQLRQHYQEVPVKRAESHRRRMGENTVNALSIYRYSRWFDWTAAQRKAFKKHLPPSQAEKAIVGWFLDIDPEVGFLDRMTTWVGKTMAGTILSYSLKGEAQILINDRVVRVPEGEGICFNLREIHEIKPSPNGQLWACLMVLEEPTAFITP